MGNIQDEFEDPEVCEEDEADGWTPEAAKAHLESLVRFDEPMNPPAAPWTAWHVFQVAVFWMTIVAAYVFHPILGTAALVVLPLMIVQGRNE